MRSVVFMAMMAMLATAVSATHVCNSGWSAYVPSCGDHSFAIEGCDAVYDELIKQSFPNNNCTFLTVLEKEAVCMTTKGTMEYAATCRNDGIYGFDAVVVVKCRSGVERWKTATTGVMTNGTIVFEDMAHDPMHWTL
jgi:hypothetical protein